MLPVDLACVKDGARVEVPVGELPAGGLLVDIGHQTVDVFRAAIGAAGTVFANGPAGVFEMPESEYGTQSIWQAMADAPGYTALGGGDSIAAMNRYGLGGRFSYVCTAGGAMVQFLSGKPLPVVEALRGAAVRFA